MQAKVLFDFEGDPSKDELSVRTGEVVTVLKTDVGDGWWYGVNEDKQHQGLFPASYVETVSSPPTTELFPPPPIGSTSPEPSSQLTDLHESSMCRSIPLAPSNGSTISVNTSTTGAPRRPATSQSVLDSGSVFSDECEGDSNTSETFSQQDTNFGSLKPGSRTTSINHKNLKRLQGSSFGRTAGDLYLTAQLDKVTVTPKNFIPIYENGEGPVWALEFTPTLYTLAEPSKKTKYKGMKSYITYAITNTATNRVVCHRSKHFDWLYDGLSEKFPCILVPPLPDKVPAGFTGDEAVMRRLVLLQQWLCRIGRHPVLSCSEMFQHFINTCSETSTKNWKAGKKRCNSDKFVGHLIYLLIQLPPTLTPVLRIDSQAESYRDLAKGMDDSIKVLLKAIEERTERHAKGYRSDYRKFSSAMQVLCSVFTRDQVPGSFMLSQALKQTVQNYDEIAETTARQPLQDLIPLSEVLKEYQSLLSNHSDLFSIQKSVSGKLRECEKLQDGDKVEYTTVAEICSRVNTVNCAYLAEFAHFHSERVLDFKLAMQKYLQEQVHYYQDIASRLQRCQNAFAGIDLK